jgi:soluble lytic murein transglycosylase-like protein
MGNRFRQATADLGLFTVWDDLIRAETDNASEAWLVKAIIATESAWNPSAVNPHDPSYGLMQVLLGSRGPYPDVSADQLLDPSTNIILGTRFLKSLISRYGSTSDAISAYNAGHPLRNLSAGGFTNQDYVDTVQTYWTYYLNASAGVPLDSVREVEMTVTGRGAQSASFPWGIALLGLAVVLAGER